MLKRVFLLLLAVIFVKQSVAEENIITLLKKYEEESDLSRKTRRETLGHYYIFTRKDLDVMHAYTLTDVLRAIPMFNLLPNRFGIYTLTNPGERAGIAIKYRLYIDDMEVSSIQTSNPFLIYDHYPLDNINHIEIYYSMGAISISNEPAQVIIKMYTKEPERENSSNIRLTKDIRQSYTGNIVIAKKINEDESFLFMADRTDYDYKSRRVSNGSISKDLALKTLFFKYRLGQYIFETGYIAVHRDPFTGFALDAVPDSGKIDSVDFYFYVTRYFMDDNSLKVNISYDNQVREYCEKNKEGIFYPIVLFNPTDPIVLYNEKRTFEKFGFYIEKKFKTRKNELLLGSYLKYNRQKLNKVIYQLSDGYTSTDIYGYYVKNFRNYSVYIENIYSAFENLSLIGGVRLDDFKFYGMDSERKLNIRAGLSSILEKVYIKGFFSYSYLLPSFYLLENAENNRLSPMRIRVLTGEVGYRFSPTGYVSFTAQFYKAKNHFDFDRTINRIINGRDKDFRVFSLLYRQEIGLFNTLELNYWFTNQGDTSLSPSNGGYLKLFTDINRLKIYNELVYRAPYRPVIFDFKASWLYNLSVTYRLQDDLSINFRADNILGSSVRAARIFPLGRPVEYPAYDRRYMVSLSKTF
ncbi:hypothetical protein [Persephonella sp.]